jgi:hypothetical protein
MSDKLHVLVAAAPLFGSTSTLLAASDGDKTKRHDYDYATRPVAPQNWSRRDSVDPERGFVGIKDYRPNSYEPC